MCIYAHITTIAFCPEEQVNVLLDVDMVGDRVKLRRIEGRPAEPVIATHRVTDYCCLRGVICVVRDAISWKPGQASLQLRSDSIINRGIHVFMYVISYGQDC